jgi:hypothetical protein
VKTVSGDRRSMGLCSGWADADQARLRTAAAASNAGQARWSQGVL